MTEETDEQWDKSYDRAVNIIYHNFEVYLKDHPAKHTILGEAASDVHTAILEALRGEF